MRVIVIGSARQRQDLREHLEGTAPDVVAEFSSLAEAKDSDIAADAFLLAAPTVSPDLDDGARRSNR